MCMSGLPVHMSMYQMSVWYPQRPEKGAGSSGTGILDSRRKPWGCWELKLCPLEEQLTNNS